MLYNVLDANQGSWFSKGANIPVPVHAATFNALGYNAVVYATMQLEQKILKEAEKTMTNFYYWADLVGEGLGCSGVFHRIGTDVMLEGKDLYNEYLRPEDERDAWFVVRNNDLHGIKIFHNDYDFLYATNDAPVKWSPDDDSRTVDHSYDYWID